jgi:hypothetical protein
LWLIEAEQMLRHHYQKAAQKSDAKSDRRRSLQLFEDSCLYIID